ncbi:restriction endonuclease subunit S [Stackebrandtia albiflava]|uniref:restriction endonuclease subunit S n=1 Tax=Stackebrandtia albiflava TaxID=406432 RepID=UPI0011BF32B1|nr:restriction endonuclease subunit S [Stackebrandtia albiflava]
MEPLIRPLPPDWATVCLEKLARLSSGYSGASETGGRPDERGRPLIKPSHIDDGDIIERDIEYVRTTSRRSAESLELAVGDILISRVATIGHIALVRAKHHGWLFSSGLIRIRVKSSTITPEYLHHYLRLPVVRKWLDHHATGTAMRSISAELLRGLPVSVPPLDVQSQITEMLDGLDAQIRAHRSVVDAATRLRSSMGLSLMTGTLRVSPSP